jgi:hypothetical protein
VSFQFPLLLPSISILDKTVAEGIYQPQSADEDSQLASSNPVTEDIPPGLLLLHH